nr:agglutinin-2 [Quercus suber]
MNDIITFQVHHWDARTGRLTDFTTQFSFIIKTIDDEPPLYGDGHAFLIATFESNIPSNSSGRYLGLFSSEDVFNTSRNQTVAVEFDSYKNSWDPYANHVGINVNSIESVLFTDLIWESSIEYGSRVYASVDYNSTTKSLSVTVTNTNFVSFISYVIDLSHVLPEWVRVGFSATTGRLSYIKFVLGHSLQHLETEDRKRKNKVGL